jgi:acetyl-CoA C-acetyltransferase
VKVGNASGINDGAAMVLLAHADALSAHALQSRAGIVAASTTGCDPVTMGLGPVGAIREVLRRAGWEPGAADVLEIDEASAAQTLGCTHQLSLDSTKVKVWGGAVALGHPVGATGARVLVTLLHPMEYLGSRHGGRGLRVTLLKAISRGRFVTLGHERVPACRHDRTAYGLSAASVGTTARQSRRLVKRPAHPHGKASRKIELNTSS